MIIAIEDTDGAEVAAERRGLAVIMDGAPIYHVIYETQFHVTGPVTTGASVG